MPGVIEAITFLVLSAQAGAFGAGILAVASVYAGTLVAIGLSVGLSLLTSSRYQSQAQAPKPEDVQQSFRQATAPRVRHYGRVKVSGPWVFAEASQGYFHKVLAIGHGRIDAVEEYWLDDNPVTLSGVWVQTAPWTDLVHIDVRLGNPTETPYSLLSSYFPVWTSDHRGDGVASLYAIQRSVSQADINRLFPNLINTSYRLVIRGALIENPVTSAVVWDDNAASVIRDYIINPDGMRLPLSVVTTPLAQAGWEEAYNRSAEAMPLKAGGSEPRYRLWGSYRLDERPADVLGRFLQCCDGRLVPTPDGGLTLDIGEWAEPTVILDADAIVGFAEIGRGRDILNTANTIRATYLEPAQDYQAADADPWIDDADVSDRGEISQDIAFNLAPSHSQARRLMKLAAYRAAPDWVGQFRCNLRGLAAIGERFVRIQYPLLGIDRTFEVQDIRFDLGEGGILIGVTITAQTLPRAATQWDPEQEEGDAPVMDQSEPDDELPVPDAPDVAFDTGPVAVLTFAASDSVLLSYKVHFRKTADSDWTVSAALDNDATSYTTPTLSASTEYEFALSFVTEKGRDGARGDSTVDTTP